MANPESEQNHDTVPPILPVKTNVPSSSGSDNASQDEEDDGQALLPRHTKVRVTGNNRTKQSLVGLTGVVKKAVGLGGWHWLVCITTHRLYQLQLLLFWKSYEAPAFGLSLSCSGCAEHWQTDAYAVDIDASQ